MRDESGKRIRFVPIPKATWPVMVVNMPPGGVILKEIIRQAIVEALKTTDWFQNKAAELLSIGAHEVESIVRRNGILPPGKTDWQGNPGRAHRSGKKKYKGMPAPEKEGTGWTQVVAPVPSSGIPLEEIKRQAVIRTFVANDWVKSDTAESLGVGARMLRQMVERYHIRMPNGRQWYGNSSRSQSSRKKLNKKGEE